VARRVETVDEYRAEDRMSVPRCELIDQVFRTRSPISARIFAVSAVQSAIGPGGGQTKKPGGPGSSGTARDVAENIGSGDIITAT